MSLVKFQSGRTRLAAFGIDTAIPITYNAADYEGAIVYGTNNKLWYSNGNNWIELLKQLIDRPAAIAPTNAAEQRMMRLSSYSSETITQTDVVFQVSLNGTFEAGDIFQVPAIGQTALGVTDHYAITEADATRWGLGYGSTFVWRGAYIGGGVRSDFSPEFTQTYPKQLNDPVAMTLSGEQVSQLLISAADTAFPSLFAATGAQLEIYPAGTGGPAETALNIGALASQTTAAALTGTLEIPTTLQDGTEYYFRARYVFSGSGGTGTTEWTELVRFRPLPATMVLEYNMALGTTSNTVDLPLYGTGLNVSVEYTGAAGTATDTVTSAGWHSRDVMALVTAANKTVTVKISGTLPRYGGVPSQNNNYSQEKLVAVRAIGSEMSLTSLYHAFQNAVNLTAVPLTIPSGITDLEATFHSCQRFNFPIGRWDVSAVIDMESTFNGCLAFNQDVSAWDVSRVVYMNGLFGNCQQFKQSLVAWESRTGAVENMDSMFSGCSQFNSPLPGFVTSTCRSFSNMFNGCAAFNQDLSSWDVSQVTDFHSLFEGCSNFNGALTNWDTGNASTMAQMFRGCRIFNQPVTHFDTHNVDDMSYMFQGAFAFNQDLVTNGNIWNVSKCTNFAYMFDYYYGSDMPTTMAFNGNLSSWRFSTDVNHNINCSGMFRRCYNFSADISAWTTQRVSNMGEMFRECSIFNADLSSWNVSNVGATGGENDGFQWMFYRAYAFNPTGVTDLSGWDVSNGQRIEYMFRDSGVTVPGIGQWLNTASGHSYTNLTAMFYGATGFNEDIGDWDLTLGPVTHLSYIFYGATSFNNGGQSLNWNTSSVTHFLYMFGSCRNFTQDITGWNVSAGKDFSSMLRAMPQFNQNISGWNMQAAQQCSWMFGFSSSFNQDISGWFTSGAALTNTSAMFWGCTAFNCGEAQNVHTKTLNWDMSNVTRSAYMFYAASRFNQNISNWDMSSVESMYAMFRSAVDFNNGDAAGASTTPLIWNTSACGDFRYCFQNAYSFNQPLTLTNAATDWSLAGITAASNMGLDAMFYGSFVFNQPLPTSWATAMANIKSLYRTFRDARAFDQNISAWNVTNVTSLSEAFYNAGAFNQNLGAWDIDSVVDATNMFGYSSTSYAPTLSTANYNATLAGWVATGYRNNVVFHGGRSTHNTTGTTARNTLTSAGWQITDGGAAA